MINVTIPNLPKFQKALKKYPQLAEKEIKDALTKSLYQIVRETKPITPWKTSRLKNSIGESGGDGIFKVEKMKGTVGTNVKYAVYVHEGYQRHPHGQRLFLTTGVKKSINAIKGFFKEALDNVFNKIASDSN
jgi:hypothetical protein